MHTRSFAHLVHFGVVLAAVVGCGGDATKRQATANANGGSAATGEGGANATEARAGAGATPTNAGGTATTSNASGGVDACPDTTKPEQPISGPPTDVGCYVGLNGSWHAVPCECDLWVDSPLVEELRASFTLSFSPASFAPSLDGNVDVEMVFPDATAAWFDTWRQQAELTTSFEVSHSSDAGTTTVRLGQGEVTLEAVPLAACESRRPHATIKAPWGTALRLDMRATLSDASGNSVATIDNQCEQLQSHPTFKSGEAGAAGAPL